MFLTITLVVSTVVAIYVYLTWNFGYWKKRNVPGPDPLPFLGSFPSLILRNRTVMKEMDKIYSDYKKKFNFVGIFSTRSPSIFVTSPALAKDILIKDFKSFHDNEFGGFTDKEIDPILGRNPFSLNGEEWKEKRSEITPAFTTSRMKALFPIIEDVGSRMTKYVKQKGSAALDTRELTAKFTTDVVSSCIFDTDAESFTNEKAEIREMGRKLLDNSAMFLINALFVGIMPSVAKLLNIGLIPKTVEKFFTNLMSEAVKHRENKGIKRVDYLEHLISLRNKKDITELDMAAHGVSFFIDGFETSSIAMAFVLYELARNPDVQKQLREELLKASNDQGAISYDTLLELPYLEQVINEALRLWPPAAFMSKKCTEPIDLELTSSQKVRIERGVYAMIPVWSIHRDPEYYEDPATFNPDRFSLERGGANLYREKGCFMPFGDGPRQCLGMRFARMQVKRGVYEILKNFELTVDSKTIQPLQIDPKQFLTMALGGIWLNYKAIN